MTQISTVLVANRAEIALRIIRGIHDQGLKSVAIYADQDRESSFTAEATTAYSLNGTSAADTYMNGEKILEIAARANVDAIHPGYGFLAENAEFAQAVTEAGLIWIGPSAQSIEALGDKVKARNVALRVGVAPVPGTVDPLKNRQEVEEFVGRHGYPIILKRADGGGGRGITVITNETELEHFFTGRPDEALSAFFVERFVQKARHIETQCGRDQHGNFVVYSTRDCTLQRRHQKLIEEAPAPFLSPEIAAQLEDASKRLLEGVDYIGLGTCEFLLDPEGNVFFLEVNPRLQVEHTVTEEVSGIDLVGEQLRIAAGKTLTTDIINRGHSIELRITSENPADNLNPSLGTLTEIQWPTGPGVRIDTGVQIGNTVSPDFDSMIAKVIITAPNRTQALKRACRALKDIRISGVATPITLYQEVMATPEFENLTIYTRWLEDEFLPTFLEQFSNQETENQETENQETGTVSSSAGTGEDNLNGLTHFAVELDGRRHDLGLPTAFFRSSWLQSSGTQPRPTQTQPLRSSREPNRATSSTVTSSDQVTSPLQAIIVRVGVETGQEVTEGDLLLVLESMKMEKYIHAPQSGIVKEILVNTGDNVSPGQLLVQLTDSNDNHSASQNRLSEEEK